MLIVVIQNGLCSFGDVNAQTLAAILYQMSASINLALHTFIFDLVDCECYSARRSICCCDLSSHSFVVLLYIHVEVIGTLLILLHLIANVRA